jgi:hypothetical protein
MVSRVAVLDRLLTAWNNGDPEVVCELVTTDYQGHMLHLPSGERSAEEYAQRIRDYRFAYPGAWFDVLDRGSSGDKVWTRLRASLPSGESAHGVNICRFVETRIAEEWAIWSAWSLRSGTS